MPYYDLARIKALIAADQWAIANDRVDRTLANLGWDDARLAEVIAQLTCDDFQKCVPNCKADLSGEVIDADQYRLWWDEDRVVECPHLHKLHWSSPLRSRSPWILMGSSPRL